MGRPVYSQERVEQGRRALCDAALQLYRDRGYSAVTLREIGAAAGVSSATPYRFFESKETLFSHVRATVYTHFGDFLRKADPKSGDPLLRLRKIALAMIEFGLRYPADYRLIFSMRQPPVAVGSALYVARRRTLEHVVPICQEIIDSGRFTGDARVHVHIAWTALHGLISFHVSNQLIHGCRLQDLVEPMLDRLFAVEEPRVSRVAGRGVGVRKRRMSNSVSDRLECQPQRQPGKKQKRRAA
ncbi:MAG: TetR/AcrR family transcriptional regulator [Steroidobacteraceae bacterium]